MNPTCWICGEELTEAEVEHRIGDQDIADTDWTTWMCDKCEQAPWPEDWD